MASTAAIDSAHLEPSERWWAYTKAATFIRTVLQSILLWPVVRWLCNPFTVSGREHLSGRGPFVFAANHCSHADTAAILVALPRRLRRRTAPAAARDYFFRSRAGGAAVAAGIGAFPFERSGSDGLERARRLLDRGHSVLLFPEGTRSRNGDLARFHCGIGALASQGFTIVPVAVSGTREVLAPSKKLPRQAAVSVAFGEPMRWVRGAPARPVADRLRAEVGTLVGRARATRGEPRPTWWTRARALASSPWGPALAFAWGVAEALLFPIVPDYALALMALAAPARWLPTTLCALAGSVAGGAIAHALDAVGLGDSVLRAAPLVTDRMEVQASQWLAHEGVRGLVHQPLSGVPFKAFALQSAELGIAPFLVWSALVRGARLLAIAALCALLGTSLRRWWPRFYGVFFVWFTSGFLGGLMGVVTNWR